MNELMSLNQSRLQVICTRNSSQSQYYGNFLFLVLILACSWTSKISLSYISGLLIFGISSLLSVLKVLLLFQVLWKHELH